MGYSMGARITAFLALTHPSRVRSATFGGLGINLVEGQALPPSVADAMEAPSLADVQDPFGRTFRAFAEQTKSDLKALAACIRGSRQTLVARGSRDDPRTGADCGRQPRTSSPVRRTNWRRSFRARRRSIFRAAITCLRSATRCSSRDSWIFSPPGRELTPPSGGEWHHPYRLNRRSSCSRLIVARMERSAIRDAHPHSASLHAGYGLC